MESTLGRLTLEEKIGQMIMSRAYGYYYSSQGDEFRRLEHLVSDHKFGGLIFFQGDVYETALLSNRLQAMAEVPLLMASDFEWGPAMRIRRTTRFPEAMAIGAARDTLLAYEMGRVIAEESRAIGIAQVFAPVADVNVNPENPVINTRSFGESPRLVADMAAAFTTGLQTGGVMATAKHFPGHGDTQTDSHLDLPLVNVSRGRMDSVELFPYPALIQRGLASVMIAHLEVPVIERKRIPATLSPIIVGDLLQRELGFNGLIVTDAMDMGALVNGFGADSAAVKAVEAGVDMLLILPDEDGAVTAIEAAVRSGRIPEERINTSVRKILRAKWDVGLAHRRTVELAQIAMHVSTPEHLILAKRIARGAITVLKNDSTLPIDRFEPTKILNVVVADIPDYRTDIHRTTSQWPNEPVGDYFTAQLRKRYSNSETVRLDPTSNAMDYEDVFKKAGSASLIVCPIFAKARSGSGIFGLPQELITVIDSLCGFQKPVVAIAMGSPYILRALPRATAYICAYSDCEAITEAVVEVLSGETTSRGRLPVTIPNMFPFGAGIELNQSVLRKDIPESAGFVRESLARLDSIMTKAVRDSAFPGGQLLLVSDGVVVYHRSFGRQEYSQGSPEINSSTMYDIASLTKVIATTSAMMKLYDDGAYRLDDSVVKYIPEFANHGKEMITIRHLLLHKGGLPPFKRLFLTCNSAQQVLDSVYQTETIYPPGDSTVYSDFDFIVLGKIVERISGMALDEYVDRNFFKPLGMTRTMYKPLPLLWENVAPTEYDTLYRKKLVRGVVHDENADALGGVSGHAGLFSTASDLAVLMQMLMNGGTYGRKQYLKPETIKLFTARQSTLSTRALGWDTKTMSGYSSAGSLMGETSFGHTGFTGTSVWADPERKIFVILLTNRVYPTRNNSKIMQIRPAVHDLVIKALK